MISYLNIFSALAVGILIGLMAMVQSVRLKATIYALPIPITVALIATQGAVNSSNIIGLMLICGFIWMVKYLHGHHKLHIVTSDIIAAITYLSAGYITVRFLSVSFTWLIFIYCISWALIMWLYQKRPVTEKLTKPDPTPPVIKGTGATLLSLPLFYLKDVLAGIVVTFPYSGVFAVIETRHNLATFLRIVIRNSLAILALFVAIYPLQEVLPLVLNLFIGWSAYFAVFAIIRKIPV